MEKNYTPRWPEGDDGEVFRRLHARGFNFSKTYSLDFYVDFNSWPPRPEVIKELKSKYSNVQIYSEENGECYILILLNSKLTYQIVIETQCNLSAMCSRFGGNCDSWGVLHD